MAKAQKPTRKDNEQKGDSEMTQHTYTARFGAPIKTWTRDGFRLRLWATGERDWRGQTRLAYSFADRAWSGEPGEVFAGEDFAGSPMHADDSMETVRGLLSFLSLRPGDTDSEYFADYTERQRAWCDDRAEYLSCFTMDPKERGK
jgi:hypothetical protein